VFEKRVLMRIFGSMREDATEGWRKLHNEVLKILHCSRNIDNYGSQIKEDLMGRAISMHE